MGLGGSSGGWQASGSGGSGATTLISLTWAQLVAKTLAGSVVAGQEYLITDKADEGIMVIGATNKTVSVEAVGNFLNADFGGIGDYSSVVPAFVSNLGIWNNTLAPVVGDVSIWNCNHYVNTTGVNGSLNPNSDAVNWTLLARTRTTGFIPVSDNILYDLLNDLINQRQDSNGNTVLFATQYFPWGNSSFAGNTFTILNSGLDARNATPNRFGVVYCNFSNYSGGGTAVFNGFSGSLYKVSFGNISGAYANTFIDFSSCLGSFSNCSFSNGCFITASLGLGVTVTNVNISLPVYYSFDPSISLQNKTCAVGYSNLESVTTISQSLNFVSIPFKTLVGVILVGDIATDGVTGAVGSVVAIGAGGTNVLVDMNLSGSGLKFNDTNPITFVGGGATAIVNGTPQVVTHVTYDTLVGVGYVVGHTLTDLTTTKTGVCVFNDGVGNLGLNNVTGLLTPGDVLRDSNGTTSNILTTQYMTVDLFHQDYAGIVNLQISTTVEVIEAIRNFSTHFNTRLTSNTPLGVVDIGAGLNGDLYLDSSDKIVGITYLAIASGSNTDFIEFTNNSYVPNNLLFYNKVNY